jgi:hypothetical protein
VGGLVTALWGLGPFVSIGFFALAGALMLLSWPTESKARLLWNRAEALRE